MSAERSRYHLKPFFKTYTLRAFKSLNLGDELIIDYISDMLADFARVDNLYRIRNLNKERIETVTEMLLLLMEGEEVRNRREFERRIKKHIGDYTLFMTGIFREYVQRKSLLDFYKSSGKSSYMDVYEIDRMMLKDRSLIFRELSEGFEKYSEAIYYMKKIYFYMERVPSGYEAILREIFEDPS